MEINVGAVYFVAFGNLGYFEIVNNHEKQRTFGMCCVL